MGGFRSRAGRASAALLALRLLVPDGWAQDEAGADEQLPTVPVDEEPTQTGEATTLDTIVVTGSRIRRTDYETAAPVLVITREQIERSGLANIGELLQQLPEAGAAQNRNKNNGGNGQTEFDLRNLGSHRTVVLVDGHRWINGVDAFNTTAVDLNSFPISIIERVEVLKDGASAIYGSDAITGVANIITRRQTTGNLLAAQWGAYDRGDGLSQRYNLASALSFAGADVLLDLSYVQQDALFAGDRDTTGVPKVGTGASRGSWWTPRGHPYFLAEPQVADALNAVDPENCPDLAVSLAEAETGVDVPEFAPAGGSLPLCNIILAPGQTIGSGETLATAATKYQPFDGANDPYNYAPLNYLLTPFGQRTAFAQASRPFGTSQVVVLALYNNFRSARRLAETPLFFGTFFRPYPAGDAYVHRASIYNPFGQDIGHYAGQGDSNDPGIGAGAGTVLRRTEEAGPRFIARDNRVSFVRAIVEGEHLAAWDEAVSWEIGGSWGRNKQTTHQTGDFDVSRVKHALGPSFLDPVTGVPTCGTPDAVIEGCVPLNVLGVPGTSSGITPAMLDYLTFETSSGAAYTAVNAFVNATAEIPLLARWLPASPGFAAGLEFRSESYRENPDPYQVLGLSSLDLPRQATNGNRRVWEAYVETSWPLARELPLVHDLEVLLAARYSEYSGFVPGLTRKAGVRYKPVADLLLRGTWSEAFRAPSITEQFLGETATQEFLFLDPCYETPARKDNVDQHCNEEGALVANPNFFVPVRQVYGGNPDLDPELAETWTAGLVYSPELLEGFDLNADWFHIALDNYIGYLTPQFILDSCYGRPLDAPRPDTCDRAHRDDLGTLTRLDLRTYNFDRASTSGVDVGTGYTLPLDPALGRYRLRLDSQYLIHFDTFVAVPNGPSQEFSEAGYIQTNEGFFAGDFPLPRFKANASLAWSLAPWEASWSTRYISAYWEPCHGDGFFPPLAAYGVCSHPAVEIPEDPDVLGDDRSLNRVPATWYHDVRAGLQLPWRDAHIVLGVSNVLDQDPPLSYSAFANTYAGSGMYSAPGSRRPYLEFRMGL